MKTVIILVCLGFIAGILSKAVFGMKVYSTEFFVLVGLVFLTFVLGFVAKTMEDKDE